MTETRGCDIHVEPTGEDSYGGRVQHFLYLHEVLHVGASSSEDEETLLPTSEHTAPGVRFCLGMEHCTSPKQAQLLITVVCMPIVN